MMQPNIEDFTEQDIAKLEQEVEDLLKNRFSQGGLMDGNPPHGGLVNIQGGDFRITKSAHVGKRAQINNLMNSAYNSSTKKKNLLHN
jgi:hypothetical protein